MKGDLGVADRIIRILLSIYLFSEGISGHVWGFIGIVPLVTGTIGWCPIYRLLGISTLCSSCTGETCGSDRES